MRTSPYSLVAAVAFGFFLGRGCGGDKTVPSQGSGSAPAGVELFIDGAAVATIPATRLASWPRLDTLVPSEARKLGTWELIALTSDKPTPTEIRRPSSSYPDMVPALFLGDRAAPAFGFFDPVELARKGKPALREDHIRAIRITLAQGGSRGQNDDGGGPAADPTKLVLTIKSASGTATLTGDQLVAMPREPMPGSPDQKGWRLTALLAAVGVTRYDRLVLTDAAGTSLTLDRSDLGDDTIPFVKLNKQGALRFRVFKRAGDGWTSSGDLRGLVAIEAK